jgi:hypothetical protein
MHEARRQMQLLSAQCKVGFHTVLVMRPLSAVLSEGPRMLTKLPFRQSLLPVCSTLDLAHIQDDEY